MDISALLNLATSSAGLLLGISRKGGASDAWQTAAQTYGLLHKPSSFWSGPKLSGSLSGNELTVDLKNRNSASEATRFRLGMPSLNRGLRLRKRGFWNSIGPHTTIGDKAFDRQIVVDGSNAFTVRQFLTPERRTALQSFLTSFKGAVVTDDEITFTTRGRVKKSDDMLGAIDAMMHVASVLAEETHSQPVGPGQGVATAAIVPAAAAIVSAAAVKAVAPESEQAPEREPEPELAPESEREPQPEFAPGPEAGPESADQVELATAQADEHEVPLQAEADAAAPSDPLPPQEDLPGVAEFCATVFAPGALSFAANQKFKESYENERVAWTGTLETLTPYTFDFDFGSGRGIKAVLTILAGEGDGSRDVQAVIALPPGIDGLYDRIGQPVSFTGRLLKVDGLAKRVVIADAALQP